MPEASARVLIVDDHVEMANVLGEELSAAGYTVDLAASGAEAIAIAQVRLPDAVLTDLRMEPVDGMDVMAAVKALDPDVPILIMTAFGGIEGAIDAIKRGAYHYVTKPFRLDEIRVFVDRAVADRRLRDEHKALRAVAVERMGFAAMVGRSAAMRALYELIERIAPSPAPVLVRGESGTGKELVARALHYEGPRRDRPFVAINCTALPEALLESELFGHTRGAFTGAALPRRGLFVEADGGTLFLDEIGDMAPALQAKLLRALEEGEVRAVGSDASRKINVRVVAATHHDLEERIASGMFRADLYYRLNVLQIAVPPLRNRAEDVPLLVARFVARARERNPHAVVTSFSPELGRALATAVWSGNVRELENVVERLVIICPTPIAGIPDLEMHAPHILAPASPLIAAKETIMPLRKLEEEYIAWVVERCGGSKPRAAELLQIDVSTIYRRQGVRDK